MGFQSEDSIAVWEMNTFQKQMVTAGTQAHWMEKSHLAKEGQAPSSVPSAVLSPQLLCTFMQKVCFSPSSVSVGVMDPYSMASLCVRTSMMLWVFESWKMESLEGAMGGVASLGLRNGWVRLAGDKSDFSGAIPKRRSKENSLFQWYGCTWGSLLRTGQPILKEASSLKRPHQALSCKGFCVLLLCYFCLLQGPKRSL